MTTLSVVKMMMFIWLLALCGFLTAQGLGGKAGIGGKSGIGGGPVPCTAPTMTYRWAAYNPSNLCGTTGGSSCTTNGQAFYSVADSVAGNTATQTSTGSQGTYSTNAINSLPAISFTGAQFYTMGTGITAPTTFTFYAVAEVTNVSSNRGLIGANSSANFEIRTASTTPNVTLLSQATAQIAVSGTALPTSTWFTLVVTYNTVSGAYNFYKAVGGSLTSLGSGTSIASFSAATTQLGGAQSVSDFWFGSIAEWGYLNSTSTTGIAAYSQCEYGI